MLQTHSTAGSDRHPGPLAGFRVVEIASLGPGPFSAMLSDMGETLPDQLYSTQWPAMKGRLTEVFRANPLAYWNERLLNADQCYAPVIGPLEASSQPQAQARESFVNVAGVAQPAPAPKLSRTPGCVKGRAQAPGMQSRALLADWGFSVDEIQHLRDAGAVRSARNADGPS